MKTKYGLLFSLTLVASAATASADSEAVDLLPLATFESDLATTETESQSTLLRDGDTKTIAEFVVSENTPVDLVYDFADGIVAPQELIVTLPVSGEGIPPARIDVLVSTVSPTSGFRSLRTEVLDGLAQSAEIEFRATTARWVMVRLFPAQNATEVALAELALIGVEGPPETVYSFGTAPTDALTVIESLSGLAMGSFGLEDDERRLFEIAASGSFSTDDFEHAALLASGVKDPAKRAAYQRQISDLEAAARATINFNASTSESGADLLEWLHGTLLTGGYEERQTELDVVLDDGVFNCVSSAVIYVALGQRLGLDIRAIEVPDHAFAIAYDGTNHMDVETTTPQGFNPHRDRVDAFEALTGFNYIPQSNKGQRREIGMASLAALIYYNHGVTAIREERYYDALLANFRAMSLDPEFDSAVTNALAALGRWSEDLADKGKWEDAVRVAAVGADLAPDDAGLAAREVAVWQRRAIGEIDAHRAEQALEVLQQASVAVPDGGFGAMQALVLIRPAERFIEAGEWEAAFAASDPDALTLDPNALTELDDWRRGFFLRWTNSEISAAQYMRAADVLERGLAIYPDDSRLSQTAAYLGQEGARAAATYSDGLAFMSSMMTRFPTIDRISDMAENYVERTVTDRTIAPTLEAGIAVVSEANPLFKDGEIRNRLGALVYEVHGHPLIDQADWEGAAIIYSAGRKAFPDDRLLTTNARYLAQNWQRAALSDGGPDALAVVNNRLRELFPDFAAQDGFGEEEIKRQVAELATAEKFDEANAVLDRAQLILSTDSYLEMATYVIGRRATIAMNEENWSAAAEIYAAGLARFPGNRDLTRNIAFIAQEWTRAAETEGSVEGVIMAMQSLKTLFPEDEDVAGMGLATLRRAVVREVDADQAAEARRLVAAAKSLLHNEDSRALTISFFDVVAQKDMEAGNWSSALETYSEGLAIHPDARELSRNIGYIVQEWTAGALTKDGPQGFVAAATKAQSLLSDDTVTHNVLESVMGHAAEARLADNDAEGAIDLIDEVSPVLSLDASQSLKVFAYDRWAKSVGEGGGWADAVAIYERGIADVGDDRLLTNNRDWARSQIQ
ncbi:hypothetical protein [Aliiroseovarius sp. YM-037]|uniref:hypothetical protein n=1 Tax=Aliiroseovarius sp. YM-037 TaxID=3341728 RepID=UPI003A80E0E3